ncbi:MAG TPA: hypothetical protein VFU47_07865 [Armatimonadota bacterium]|nr:hypothetical protein [Armatimonadota bacterium]
MAGEPLGGVQLRTSTRNGLPGAGKWSGRLARIGAGLLARVLGTADGRAVAAMAARELSLILRSREWHLFAGKWCLLTAAILLIPLLYRSDFGNWSRPSGPGWFVLCGYALQIGLGLSMVQWTMRRIRRDIHTNRLDELLLSRCSPADIAMGEALASAIASLWLVVAAFPACLFVSAMGGLGVAGAVRLAISLAPAGALGVWFGMGWGLAFALRRTAAIVPLTQWWFLGPFMPIYVGWAALGCFPTAWALLRLIPGGERFLGGVVGVLFWLAKAVVQHGNPLLVVGAAGGQWGSTWITDWLVLFLISVFMMRKSMDAVQLSLGSLEERERRQDGEDAWIHHDSHHFVQYDEKRRREPNYRDGGNAVAAFDAALGHRVFLHPFIWTLLLMAYLFMVGWSLLVPDMGALTATAAVLIPATAALLLMSGGVAVSFGWERDQHRWPALAVLPIPDISLALGKIKGVVRPTLWTCLLASVTALVMGWRGALHMEVALWMALHVTIFPIALACVSATLALTTPTLGEALYRWAILGAIPSLAVILPYPIGGNGGMALPFTPPLLVLMLVLNGPTPELIRGAWIALGLEVFGTAGALLILSFLLRGWTVGERD